MQTKLILIRHGETEYNRKKRYSGFFNVALNKKGTSGAKKLAKRFQNEHVDVIFTSDRLRAIQTANIIFPKRKITKVPSLREINFGVFEGLTYEQIMKRFPKAYSKWLKNPYKALIPKGENLNVLKKRVLKALSNIVKENRGRTIAVVFHGGAISIFINQILKKHSFWKYIPSSASVSIVEYDDNKPKLSVFNDTKHLN